MIEGVHFGIYETQTFNALLCTLQITKSISTHVHLAQIKKEKLFDPSLHSPFHYIKWNVSFGHQCERQRRISIHKASHQQNGTFRLTSTSIFSEQRRSQERFTCSCAFPSRQNTKTRKNMFFVFPFCL